MKKVLLLLGFIIFLSLNSCQTLGTIQTVNDEYKQEETIYLEQEITANTLEKHTFRRKLQLFYVTWRKNNKTTDNELVFELSINNDQTLDDYFFIKTANQLYKVPFNNIKNSNTQGYEEENETQRKNDSTTVTTHDVDYYSYQKVKAKAILKKEILDDIAQSSSLNIRVYIDNKAFSAKYNTFKLKKLKKNIAF